MASPSKREVDLTYAKKIRHQFDYDAENFDHRDDTNPYGDFHFKSSPTAILKRRRWR